jgi:uncharacterized protein involved in cysteine biosynthesis
MIDAAVKATSQMFSAGFRSALLKSAGLALVLVILVGIVLHRVLVWLATTGADWAESVLGTTAHTPLLILSWIFSLAAGLGLLVGSIFLMPAVTALVGSMFVDNIALEVERIHYPKEPVGSPLPFMRALAEGTKTALFAILVYILAVPFLLIAGLGAVVFFFVAAFLLGREYFELAAMRHQSRAEAKQLRRNNQRTVLLAGLLIAAFASIPIINLAAPLFATALMVHVHKQVSQDRRRSTEYK